MKTLFGFFSVMLALNMLFGCQQEVVEIIEPPADKVFTSQSDIAVLIGRTSMNDGSKDNIVDGTSCGSLLLPATISVNGFVLKIDSTDDFDTVENIIDRFDDDDDEIDFAFPITVVLADYTQKVIANERQFEDFIDQCDEDSSDDDIECVDFKYPISIAIYNAENQVSDVITLTDDKKMYEFIDDLDDEEYAGFTFPVTIILFDGTEMVVSNNDDLEDVLESADGSCDKDDDIDHDDADVTEFISEITSGQWVISYFFDDEDETSAFTGYVFTFLPDGKAKAVKGESTVNGVWYGNGNNGSLELIMNFGDNDPLEELGEDWDVIQFDSLSIKLKDISGGDGSVEYLTFSRPSNNSGNQSPTGNYIEQGLWIVDSYIEGDDDKTSDFSGYDIDFLPNGTVTATKGTTIIPGTWSETSTKLILDFGVATPFDELNDDWTIVSAAASQVELSDVSGGDGSTDKLVLKKK